MFKRYLAVHSQLRLGISGGLADSPCRAGVCADHRGVSWLLTSACMKIVVGIVSPKESNPLESNVLDML